MRALLLAAGAAAVAADLVTDPYSAQFESSGVAYAPPPAPPSLAFSHAFGDSMVLQQQPASAAVYGTCPNATKSVTVKVSSSSSTYSVDAKVSNGQWKAVLKPTKAGGSYTITAAADGNTTSLSDVVFGDVWYCGGQSNMALPLVHTMSRNISYHNIMAGKYNIRIFGISGNMNPDQPWISAKDAVTGDPACPADDCDFYKYSSTCWYFGESLAEELGEDAPPIGLIHTAWGGSTIGQWLDNDTIATCKNATLSPSNQEWHETRVLPFVDMSIKGWVWYQGENDMHGTHGNSELGYGYSCLMPKLVSSWRKMWSATPGTTDAEAPFGLVTLAPSGGEGGNSMGTMRWAQTASYGVVPNPALPNTFLAQAFDLNDPWSNITCYHAACCPNNYHPTGTCNGCEMPDQYCANLSATNYYMGPIHPRDKKPVGVRLAQAGAVVAYGKSGLATGPTVSGCGVSGSELTVRFNTTLLKGDKVLVQEYDRSNAMLSKMHVLLNASMFCMQTDGRGSHETCVDDGTGKPLPATGDFDDTESVWVPVNIKSAGPSSVTVDLSGISGTVHGVRYGWTGDCCDGRAPTSKPCPVESCPLMAEGAWLPANPFMARVVNGKCKCIAPQVCDE